MLTKRQNLLETIRGGNPVSSARPYPRPGGPETVVSWGVTIKWPAGFPGPFPMHDEAHKVVKDITKWKEVVQAPSLDYPAEAWKGVADRAAAIDRNEQFVTVMGAPGIFEQVHYLTGIDDALMYYYEEPEAMHELIDYITDWKCRYAELVCKYVKPDALFHHDDWGTQLNSFISPAMFEEFIAPAFKKVYDTYSANGVELIVHHSDSYAANLVPYMIDMGIDIWQGAMTGNNVPELVKKYGGKISFMGDLNNGVLDKADWTPELIRSEVERACRSNGKLYFIPCLTMGGPGSTYPGVYDTVSAEIDRMSKEMF